jgi:hypothetical protein
MPLTKTEHAFLDAYVFEVTNQPFGGPATTDLHRRGIHYSDLNWILTAYDRELSSQRISPLGRHNPDPPSSPWAEVAHAKRRNAELRLEWESQPTAPVNGKTAISAANGPSHDVTKAGNER